MKKWLTRLCSALFLLAALTLPAAEKSDNNQNQRIPIGPNKIIKINNGTKSSTRTERQARNERTKKSTKERNEIERDASDTTFKTAKDLKKKNIRVLFLGNSYTFVHRVPDAVVALGKKRGYKIEAEMIAPGAWTLLEHSQGKVPDNFQSRNALQALQSEEWDYVVLQDQSSTPSIYPKNTADALETLKPILDKCGAQAVLYVTPAHFVPANEGEARDCNKKYMDDEQEKLNQGYLIPGKKLNMMSAPVGPAFNAYYDKNYDRSLHSENRDDNSHFSKDGAYLAAVVLYATITGDKTDGLPDINYVSGSRAKELQKLAADVIEKWQADLGVAQKSKPSTSKAKKDNSRTKKNAKESKNELVKLDEAKFPFKSAKELNKKKIRVLFLGNSLTFNQRLPERIVALGKARGYTIEHKMIAPGAWLLEQHGSGNVPEGFDSPVDVMKNEKWDFVIMQDQSGTPSTSYQLTDRGVALLKPLVDGCGAQGILYVTPSQFCPRPEEKKAMDEEQTFLNNGYLRPALRHHIMTAPVGPAFNAYYDKNYDGKLHGSDGLHYSGPGAYIAALVLYATITGDDIANLPDLNMTDNAQQTKQLKKIAQEVIAAWRVKLNGLTEEQIAPPPPTDWAAIKKQFEEDQKKKAEQEKQ